VRALRLIGYVNVGFAAASACFFIVRPDPVTAVACVVALAGAVVCLSAGEL